MTSKTFDPIAPPASDDGFVEVEVVVSPIQVQEIDRGEDDDEDVHAIMTGACVAGACVGCLVGGPVVACIAGAGSAYGTTTRGSAAGDCTRSMGRLALSCRQKAIMVNEKHHVVDKTRTAAVSCWTKSKDMNERHQMVERTNGCLKATWEGTKTANRKYRIVDRAFEGIAYTVSYINDKIIGDETAAAAAAVSAPPAEGVAASSTREASPLEEDEGGESRTPARGEAKNGSYGAVKTSDDAN